MTVKEKKEEIKKQGRDKEDVMFLDKKGDIKDIKEKFEQISAIKTALMELTENLYIAEKRLWRVIKERYPQTKVGIWRLECNEEDTIPVALIRLLKDMPKENKYDM